MLVLAIDASSAAVTVGVARVQPAPPVRVIAQRTVIDARAHAELLSSFARECVAEAGADMGDLQAVVGGIGSIAGAVLGGLLLGLIELMTIAVLPELTGYKDAFAFVLLIMVLLVKPTGLLGKNQGEKV